MIENLVFDPLRFKTGLILVLVLFSLYFFNLGLVLISLIILLSIYDLYSSNIYNNFIFPILIIILSLTMISLFLLNIKINHLIIIITFFILLSFFDFSLKLSFMTVIFLFFLLLIMLLTENNQFIFLIILLSFINDSFAFITGKYFKGPLIIPSISPKKTWSGTLCSLLISFLILTFFFEFDFIKSIFVASSLFFGDIYFSYIKRSINIKDFSNILPGHGGILDRLDSIFLCTYTITIFSVFQ